MAIIDVVKYEANGNEFVFKFPSQDLRIGTQLVVGVAQVAFFVKGGKIFDQFETGTHTLKSENLPFLNKVINLPFGGSSPFQAEVWYINLISKLDVKWGTSTPIQLEDPKYGIIIPVRAYGQYGFRIIDSRKFLETLVGNMHIFSVEKINEYFKGKILSSLTSIISAKLVTDNISILEINTLLEELSNSAIDRLNTEFIKFGIEVINFYFISINVPEEDSSLIKIKEAKATAAKIQIMGKDVYQMDRSFNVLDKAAENGSGIAGNLMGAGMGIGLGVGLGNQMNNLSGNLNTNIPPTLSPVQTFFVIIDNQEKGPFDLNKIKELIIKKIVTKETLVWNSGMPNWEIANKHPEFENIFKSVPPPLPK